MQSSIPSRGPVQLMPALVPAMLMGWCISNLAFAQWTSDRNTNMPVCTASGDQMYPSIISDNAGGAIIVWQDSRNGKLDIYAQRLDAKGTALWGKNGVAVCLASNDQRRIKTAGDGSGGVIIVWTDLRNSTFHLYAQRIDAVGQPATTADTSFVHHGVPANRNHYYALRAVDVHGNRSTKSNEAAVVLVGVEATPAIAAAFSLEQNYPNPFNPSTTIALTLLRSAFVTVKFLTIQGEEVATLVEEKLPAGKHQRVWEAKGLASGVYLYRLEAGEFAQVKKLILLQ